MRFDRDHDGSWLVDPNHLAERLGITPSDLKRRMALGQVTSRVEAGSGEDEGRYRVTIRLAGTAWQAIFDTGGRLISERRL